MIRLIAIAPEDGWAFVRSADRILLLRPPYGKRHHLSVEESVVARAIAVEGFEAADQAFTDWPALLAFLEKQFLAHRSTLPRTLTPEAVERILRHAPFSVLESFLNRIEHELLPSQRWDAAEELLARFLAVNSPASALLRSRATELLVDCQQVRSAPGQRRQWLIDAVQVPLSTAGIEPMRASAEGSQIQFSNGVDAATGNYLPAPASLAYLGAVLLQKGQVPKLGKDYENNADFQQTDDIDAQDLANTGWGVIFAEGTDPVVREALAPLLELRERQANKIFEGYREFHGPLGYRQGQTQEDFVSQWKIKTKGLVDPTMMPYYLLLVGSPEEMGFDFQYEMDVAHAVGRIHFDTPDEYACYAQTLVAAEQRRHARQATVFGVRNGDEKSTHLLLDLLVLKAIESLEVNHPDWTIERALEHAASKKRLEEILREPPSLLFTAGHGLCFPKNDLRQVAEQGAIVCSDWPGAGPLSPGAYYSAEDVNSSADLAGMMVFQYSCFSAATPADSDLKRLIEDDLWSSSGRPFVAALPKRLLSLPGGRGASAVIGHVGRIWQYSFLDEETDLAGNFAIGQCLKRLLRGYRVGYAMEYLNRWHTNYAVRLATLFSREKRGQGVDSRSLARTWLTNNDARNYVLLGDPAARLTVE